MINYNKLNKAAKSGNFDVKMKIDNDTDVQKLKHDGFVVKDLEKSKNFPKNFKISWKNAMKECEDIEILNENSYIYTLPEKLWIIAKKARQFS